MELENNPFAILGANIEDDEDRIYELAEKIKNSDIDKETINDATWKLTNPRGRLAALIGWFPGLDPEEIQDARSQLNRGEDPTTKYAPGTLLSLTRANLLANGLGINPRAEPREWEELTMRIVRLAQVHDEIYEELEQTVALLNELLHKRYFRKTANRKNVKKELKERRRAYGKAIKDALDKLPMATFWQIIYGVVGEATHCGSHRAPSLVVDVVKSYRTSYPSKTNTDTIDNLIREAITWSKNDKQNPSPIPKLEKEIWEWAGVYRPSHVISCSQGVHHQSSHHEVSEKILGLVDELVKSKHTKEANRLVTICPMIFSGLSERFKKSLEDAKKNISKGTDYKQKGYLDKIYNFINSGMNRNQKEK